MAITKYSLEEPMLTRAQTVVLRDIARANLLNEGLQVFLKIRDRMIVNDPHRQPTYMSTIQTYLESEIERYLMQIKTPTKTSTGSKASNEKHS